MVNLDENSNTLNTNTYNINTFNSLKDEIEPKRLQYDELYSSYIFLLDLYEKYNEDNDQYDNTFKKETSNILINERKTYYEDQGIESLNSYYYWLMIVYIISVITYIISFFIFPSDWSTTIKIVILILLIILPFVSSYILSFVVNVFYNLYNILPKNVNLTL